MKKCTSIFILICLASFARAQDRGMAFLKGVPQSHTVVNPAFQLNEDDSFYISYPVLGNFSMSVANTGFSWNDLFYEKQDSLYLDFDNLDNTLQKRNYARANMSLQILGFGFKVGEKALFTFDLNAKVKTSIGFPGDITNIRYGNWNYDANTPINQSLSGMSGDGIAYTELALGYNRKITDKLTAGVRLKYIKGALAVKTEHAHIDMTTTEDGVVTVNNDISIVSSAPIYTILDENNQVDDIEFEEELDFGSFVNKNTGFGIDLGATYQLTDKVMLAAAVNDLGFINWNANTQRFYSKGTFHYEGVDVSENIAGTAPEGQELWEDIGDDLEDSFKLDNASGESFRTGLLFNANVMGTYNLKEWVSLGGMLAFDHNWTSSLTLSASMNPGRGLSAVVTYSANKNDWAELGAGFMLRALGVQFFLMSDNLTSYLSPENAKYANLRFGMNAILRKNKKK